MARAPKKKASKPASSKAKSKPSKRKSPAAKKSKPATKKPAKKGKSTSKKKPAAKKKPTPKKSAAKKSASPKKPARRKKTASATSKQTGPKYVFQSRGKATDVVRVQARFTEPLRRFSEYQNLREVISGQANKFGDRTFLIFEDDGREFSYRTLDEQTTRFANALHQLGARKGSRIALLVENTPEFVFAFLGAMKGGYIAVPLNREVDLDQLQFQLEDCGASILVSGSKSLAKVRERIGGLPGLSAVLVTDGGADARKDDTYELLEFAKCLEAEDATNLRAGEITWWDEAQILYTGHHLDEPRGAILQHRQFMTAARWTSVWLGLDDEDRFISMLPLFHVNAQVVSLFTPLQIGGSVVLSREFGVSRIWKAVEQYGVTTLAAVPTMLGILADRELSKGRGAKRVSDAVWPSPHESCGTLGQRDDEDAREEGLARAHDIRSLERVICGSAPLPAAIQKTFEQVFLVPVIEGYSMAETTCFAALNPANGTRKIGSVGVAVGNKVAIQNESMPVKRLDDDWQPTSLTRMNPTVFPTAGINEPGEICVWGENVLKEYYDRPQANPEVFAGGWFHTGDVGRLDCDAYVYVQGPKDELVDLDGAKLAPREVDELLFAHNDVEQAATIGTEDAGRRKQITTWIVLRKGTFDDGPNDGRLPHDDAQLEAKQNEIREYLKQHLSEKKRPTTIRFTTGLPQDDKGKTNFVDLRRLTNAREQPGKGK